MDIGCYKLLYDKKHAFIKIDEMLLQDSNGVEFLVKGTIYTKYINPIDNDEYLKGWTIGKDVSHFINTNQIKINEISEKAFYKIRELLIKDAEEQRVMKISEIENIIKENE